MRALIEWFIRLFSPESKRVEIKPPKRVPPSLPMYTPSAETTLDFPPEREMEPPVNEEKPWSVFVPFLGPAMNATYLFSDAQMPSFPPGVSFLSSRYLGEQYTNCTMFTSYLLGNGFGGPFNLDQWNEWQVAKGGIESVYWGYGPGVCVQWGVGELMPEGAVPRGGVYLIQSFTTWPKGHSWLVLDYDEATGKILTLESNTTGSGLNGVGFGGLGPIRNTNAHDWVNRTDMTWEGRTKGYSQVHMVRLAIDHATVLEWIAGQ